VLADYLEKHRSLVQNKAVIELGAGTGVVGITTAMLGDLLLLYSGTDSNEITCNSIT